MLVLGCGHILPAAVPLCSLRLTSEEDIDSALDVLTKSKAWLPGIVSPTATVLFRGLRATEDSTGVYACVADPALFVTLHHEFSERFVSAGECVVLCVPGGAGVCVFVTAA